VRERIIVTGGAGFIGSAVVRRLVNRGCEVLNFDKLTYASSLTSLDSVSDRENYRFVKADINDASAVSDVLHDFEPTAVFHLAAESHVDRSIAEAGVFVTTNVLGTYTLLQASLEYWNRLGADRKASFRFLHVSTDEVYGSLGPMGLFREDTPYDPRSPYSASKAASDHLASAWFHTYGFPVLISNCSNNYGPFHFPEKLIPLTILNALERSPLSVYGDGSNIRDWLFVDDHAKALDMIVARGRIGQTYNVGGRNERTNLQVVEQICDLVDKLTGIAGEPRRGLIRYVTDRPGHDQRYAIDATKLETELGWSADETFDTGLEKTVRWYIDNQTWWRPLRKRYGGERIGLMKPQSDN
jgi:dTDP-glucose 4,6-dehydratase